MAVLREFIRRQWQRVASWWFVQRIIAALKWLAQKIAALGESSQFVAFWAHFGVSMGLVDHTRLAHKVYMASGIMVYAAVKEYWFDARYEKNPPQTFWMNTQDFIGYVAGAWLAVWWTA